MPAKSRRNRRNISRKNLTGNQAPSNTPIAASTAAPAGTIAAEKTAGSYSSAAKAAVNPDVTYPYILNEIKWIGVVTVIVAVVLVVLYIFLH